MLPPGSPYREYHGIAEEQVVFIGFGMAVVGKRVLRGYEGGFPKERRTYVDAIRGGEGQMRGS